MFDGHPGPGDVLAGARPRFAGAWSCFDGMSMMFFLAPLSRFGDVSRAVLVMFQWCLRM